MAAVAAVIAAIARSSWRDLRSLSSLTGNNILAVIVLLMAEEPVDRPSSTAIFYLLMGLLYLFPLSSDLLGRVPRERMRLWPLGPGQRTLVYAALFAMNPLLLIAVLFASLSRELLVGRVLFVAGAGAPLVTVAARYALNRIPHVNAGRLIPRLPGRLGGLIQNHLRDFIGMLDLYFAAALAVGGVAYRMLAAHPDPALPLALSILTVIFLSTMAQTQFGSDAESQRVRLRLMPLSGVEILLAKDLAWFCLALLLVLPFHVVAAASAALAALAVAHHTAVRRPIAQQRWRFACGHLAPTGLIQLACLVSAGVAAHQYGWPALLIAFAVYAGSLWWFGREWDAL